MKATVRDVLKILFNFFFVVRLNIIISTRCASFIVIHDRCEYLVPTNRFNHYLLGFFTIQIFSKESIVFCNSSGNSRDITYHEGIELNALETIKGATKSYFSHHSCVVIVLFNTDLCRSAFSTISFGKLFFSFCVFCAFCFESNALNQCIKICVIMGPCNEILLCNFVMQFFSHFTKTIY